MASPERLLVKVDLSFTRKIFFVGSGSPVRVDVVSPGIDVRTWTPAFCKAVSC